LEDYIDNTDKTGVFENAVRYNHGKILIVAAREQRRNKQIGL